LSFVFREELLARVDAVIDRAKQGSDLKTEAATTSSSASINIKVLDKPTLPAQLLQSEDGGEDAFGQEAFSTIKRAHSKLGTSTNQHTDNANESTKQVRARHPSSNDADPGRKVHVLTNGLILYSTSTYYACKACTI